MAASYDELEPWYEHLYEELHTILLAALGPPADGRARRALDAGCGTGFQTVLLERFGYQVHGIDISGRLLEVGRRRLETSVLAMASIEAVPYGDGSFDVVSCCGSTLSLCDRPGLTLREIGRVLRPGGLLLVECEHKWSLDLGWTVLSSVTGDSLGYGASPATVWRQVARPLGEGFLVDYPYLATDGTAGSMRLRLFTMQELRSMLVDAGLRPLRTWGIHMLTNLIPSTVLHRPRLSSPLALLYSGLRAIDRVLRRFPPVRGIANSLVILAKKV
jgi:SAM-dependent methyltransferase